MQNEGSPPIERMGEYEFVDRLAVGGMGELWRVRHAKLGAIYVAKVLRPELRDDAEFVRRFLHEAQLVANLRHPNVVQVFDFSEEHMLYLMEYVEGMDLDRLMRKRQVFTLAEKRIIIEVIADTIGYAHRSVDLIHRDIKPSNVLIAISDADDPIRRSNIKLTDFGIAKILSVDQRLTMSSGMVMGTVHYMAPEQFEGDAGKASDVYSIGILCYQLLTGKLPFDGPTAFVVRDRHLNDVPPAPHELNPEVPLEDSAIVMRCLAKRPEDRFADSAALFEELTTTKPTTRTIPMMRTRPGDDVPLDVTVPMSRDTAAASEIGSTERTISAPAESHTASTIPLAEGQAPVPAEPTAMTLAVERKKKPSVRRRILRAVGLTFLLLIIAAIATPFFLRPKYDVRWSTLRSDPQDTPNGIHVSICPTIGRRLTWWSVGTIGDTAPPNWSNWTTWFDGIDVKFSDGLYREFVLRCTKSKDRSYVDFGGATFEQLAREQKAEIVENPAGIGDYINAVLIPSNIGAAHSLADVQAGIERVAGLLDRAKGVKVDTTRLETYRGAVANVVAGADALLDGDLAAADSALSKAEAHVERIRQAESGRLSDDFLFLGTLRAALSDAQERAGKARRIVDGLQPLADSARSIQYTLDKYKSAHAAVADHLFFTPGRSAWVKLLDQPDADAETALVALGSSVPEPVATAQRYLAALDALVKHEPAANLEGRYRVGVLEVADAAVGAAGQVKHAEWPAKCYAPAVLAFRPVVEKFWREAAQRRLAEATRRCGAVATARIAKAEALPPVPESLASARELFQEATVCLDAIRTVPHVAEAEREAATGLLSTCCVKQAVCQFRVGPRDPAQEADHLTAIRTLLDRGLDELAGCSPEAKAEGQVLRQILKALSDARGKLAAARRENFGTKDAFEGSVDTLFGAIDAYEGLFKELDSHPNHPCREAALAPFARLTAPCCDGFTLPNAVACWVLARAGQEVEQANYGAAQKLLLAFLLAPGQEERAVESPLKRLVAKPIIEKALALLKLATAFRGAAAPAQDDPPAERWRKLWDARLAAVPLLDIDIPASVDAAALPAAHKGEAKQWEALYAQMRPVLAQFRTRIQAEQDLRKLEARAGGLLERQGDIVRPKPGVGTPDALAKCADAVAALKSSGRYDRGDDHPARVAALQRDLTIVQAGVTGLKKRIADMLAKNDSKAALDVLAAGGAVLGKAAELELTHQALAAWTSSAQKSLDGGKFDEALASYKGITAHEQLRRHAADAKVKAALGSAAAAVSYCQGQVALAAGARGFGDALTNFQKAGDYRDAAQLAKQIGPVQEALRLSTVDPFKAAKSLTDVLAATDLVPAVRQAAEKEARQIRLTFIVGAAACTRAFNDALAKGGWERYLDRRAIADQEIQRLKTFLQNVSDLQVQQPAGQEQGTLASGRQEVELTRKRTLKFTYELPGSVKLPVSVEQTIAWTLRYTVPEGGQVRRWLIAGWREAGP